MTQRHKVEFIIKPTGEVEFTVKGISGGGCRDVQRVVEQATGIQTKGITDTGEMYEEGVEAANDVKA